MNPLRFIAEPEAYIDQRQCRAQLEQHPKSAWRSGLKPRSAQLPNGIRSSSPAALGSSWLAPAFRTSPPSIASLERRQRTRHQTKPLRVKTCVILVGYGRRTPIHIRCRRNCQRRASLYRLGSQAAHAQTSAEKIIDTKRWSPRLWLLWNVSRTLGSHRFPGADGRT